MGSGVGVCSKLDLVLVVLVLFLYAILDGFVVVSMAIPIFAGCSWLLLFMLQLVAAAIDVDVDVAAATGNVFIVLIVINIRSTCQLSQG